MKAIIFAAGLGTRLRPFTLSHPKALVEVGNKSMLQHAIERIKLAGINDIIVNVHHFAQQIIDTLEANDGFGANVSISDERNMLLDTGGGIAHAADFLRDSESFVAYNADILSDFSLDRMIATHNTTGADATLLAWERNSSRRLYFDTENRLCGWQNLNTGECQPAGFTPLYSPNSAARAERLCMEDSTQHIVECNYLTPLQPLAFGGIHIISQKTLELLVKQSQLTPVFSITPFYLENINNLDIRSFSPTEKFHWFDVGRNETLEQARACFG